MKVKSFTMEESNRGELAKALLSAKARKVLDSTDPCGIFETVEDGRKHYYITGVWTVDGSLEEVERTLEDIYDEYLDEDLAERG